MLLALLIAVDAALQPYVKVDAKAVILEHVRVIDGTGAAAREDQTVAVVDGKIAAQAPAGAQKLDLTGRTVMPGLVGMHDHLFYPMGGAIFGEMAYTFPTSRSRGRSTRARRPAPPSSSAARTSRGTGPSPCRCTPSRTPTTRGTS